MQFDSNKAYRIREIQQFLPLSRKKIYELIKSGNLQAVNVASSVRPHYLITGEALNQYLINHQTNGQVTGNL